MIVAREFGRFDTSEVLPKSCGLLRWLLVNRRTEYITQAEEDAAVRKLREHRDGPRQPVGEGDCVSRSKPVRIELTEDERFVQACLVVSRRNQRIEPHQIALEAKGWSREQWENAHTAFETRQLERWRRGDDQDQHQSQCALN